MSNANGPWWEMCEWTTQDAERTMAHLDQLCMGWTRDMGHIEDDHMEDIERSVEHLGYLLSQWEMEVRPATGLVGEAFEMLTIIAERRAWNGDVVPTHVGAVEQINASGGGVPKAAIPSASVGWRGIDGDVQHTRLHHGRPWQALCLWSADVIDGFTADGHPITAGGAGENLTLSGLDWASLRAGTVIDIGMVRCQVTAPTVPCSKVAANFVDRDISLIDHDLHPGSSRWYAAVLRPGSITTDDLVTVSPSTG